MRDERLHELLRTADAATGLPNALRDVATRVRRRVRRNQLARVTYSAAAVGCIVLAAVIDSPTAPETTSTYAAELDLNRLDQQIRLHELTAEHLLASERQRGASTTGVTTQALSPLDELQEQRDVAAAILLHQADRLMFELKQPQQAVAEYRRMIELFPDTPAAATASQRLEHSET